MSVLIGGVQQSDRWNIGGGALTHLTVVARRPIVLDETHWEPLSQEPLPAPATGHDWWANEPACYRMWAWLYDELVVTAAPEPLATDVGRTTT